MKIRVLIIEIGIKNIHSIKRCLKLRHVELIYASSFLDVVDAIHLEDVHIIVFSDFRGLKSTIGYIKMFKTTSPDFKLIIVSTQKNVKENFQSYYIQRGADSVISCYDIKSIENRIHCHCLEIFQNEEAAFEWSRCTKKAIRFLKNNYHISNKLLEILCSGINYSLSSITHSVKKDTGRSVGEWIQELRINGAVELLQTTELPIKSISSYVGYKSIQGFIKAFKKIIEKTPTAFRKDKETSSAKEEHS